MKVVIQKIPISSMGIRLKALDPSIEIFSLNPENPKTVLG